jgi:Flp pilus assembly protein TadG
MSPLLSHLLRGPDQDATKALTDEPGSEPDDGSEAAATVSSSSPEAATRSRRRAGRRRSFGGQRGQALVEFALVLPVLMLVLVGIIKGGMLYNNYLSLTDAVRSGARQLAIERGQSSPCGDAANEVISSASGLTSSNISITMTENPEASGDPAGATYTTTGSPTGTGACPFTLVSGSAATLTATYPCDLQILWFNFASTCQLSASATERVE